MRNHGLLVSLYLTLRFPRLMDGRKKRKPPPEYATAADLKTYSAKETIGSLHSASSSGINSLVISKTQPNIFLTAGNDKTVQLYDRSTNKVLATLKGHTKKVNHANFCEKDGEPTFVISASADKTSRVWMQDTASGEYSPHNTIKTHKGELTGLAVHPTKLFFGVSSSDKTFSLHNLSTSQQLFHSTPFADPFASMAFHPDGTFLALGTSRGSVQIYDSRTCSPLSPLESATGGFSVHTISFSENGYHLMAPGSPSTVAIWDLRKLSAVKTIDLGDFTINKLLYDPMCAISWRRRFGRYACLCAQDVGADSSVGRLGGQRHRVGHEWEGVMECAGQRSSHLVRVTSYNLFVMYLRPCEL